MYSEQFKLENKIKNVMQLWITKKSHQKILYNKLIIYLCIILKIINEKHYLN